MSEANARDFLINRQNLHDHKIIPSNAHAQELEQNEVRLEIDKFSLTANNITYASMGEMMKYWEFFPAEEGWGRVPVWGFGNIVESNCQALAVGERIYGFFPLSSHVILKAGKVSPFNFNDEAEHRLALPAVYNSYARTSADPAYKPELENFQALLRPLFTTSFLIDDFLRDNQFFCDASQQISRIVLASASSKTAFGAAFALQQNKSEDANYHVVGLTSPTNIDFVNSLGCYDSVESYDGVSNLSAEGTTIFVDMAGNSNVQMAVHQHFKDGLLYSCQVGLTHWDKLGFNADLPGPAPQLFFAPSQVEKRLKDWGPDGFQQALSKAWENFLGLAKSALATREQVGEEAITEIYEALLNGNADPKAGYILSF